MFLWIYAIYAYVLNVNPDVDVMSGGLYSLGCKLHAVSSLKLIGLLIAYEYYSRYFAFTLTGEIE